MQAVSSIDNGGRVWTYLIFDLSPLAHRLNKKYRPCR